MSSLSSSTGATMAISTSASGGWSLSMSISSLTRMAANGSKPLVLVEPRIRPLQEEQADVLALDQRGAERLLVAAVHRGELDGDARDDRQAALWCVGDAGERVDRRHLDRQVQAADACELCGQHEQVGRVGQRRQRPGEQQWEVEALRRVGVDVVELDHLVLEAEQGPRVDLQRQVQVDRAAARLLGVQVDLPQLA